MNALHARGVFFVADAERSRRFYTEQLGFATDWTYQEEGRTVVCQVSLLGFEVILNETNVQTQTRAGHGRIFIGVEDIGPQSSSRRFTSPSAPSLNWSQMVYSDT